jgi:hypothetical protein
LQKKQMTYTEKEEKELVAYSNQLPEKARRHFLAIQYKRLGRGSQSYLAKVFGCSRITITNGVNELESGEPIDFNRQRRAGGGRKKRAVGN